MNKILIRKMCFLFIYLRWTQEECFLSFGSILILNLTLYGDYLWPFLTHSRLSFRVSKLEATGRRFDGQKSIFLRTFSSNWMNVNGFRRDFYQRPKNEAKKMNFFLIWISIFGAKNSKKKTILTWKWMSFSIESKVFILNGRWF